MKHITLSTCLVCLLTSTAAFADAKTLTMEDLKALSDAGREREVYSQAELVPPSKRTAEWERIVTKSAKDLFVKVKEENYSEAFDVGKAMADRDPHLMKDAEFTYDIGFVGARTYSSKAVSAPFFAAALKADDDRCKVTEVRDAVSDAFTRPGFEKEKTAAKKIAFTLCAKALDEDWVQKLVDTETGLKTGCADLMKLGKLKGVKATKCKAFTKGS